MSAVVRFTGCERDVHDPSAHKLRLRAGQKAHSRSTWDPAARRSASRFHVDRAPGCDRGHCPVVFDVTAQFGAGAKLRAPGDLLLKPAPTRPGGTDVLGR